MFSIRMLKRILCIILIIFMLTTALSFGVGSAEPDIIWLDADYSHVQIFSEGMAAVEKDSKYGYIDKGGNEIIPFTNYIGGSFSGGMVSIQKYDVGSYTFGYIDKEGNEVIPCIYDNANDFSEGLATVSKDGKWGIIKNLYTIKVTLNGNYIQFDQPPIIENNRTLVPLRAIFEALGADVDWNDNTQTITAVRDDITIIMQIGNPVITVSGTEITLDVSPQLVGKRTLVPARAVAESFGASVDWAGDTQTVIITN